MIAFCGIISYRMITLLFAALIIAGIVLVSILYKGTYQVSAFSDGKTLCSLQAALTCNKTMKLPLTWKNKNIRIGIKTLSCSEIMRCDACNECLV